MIKKIAYKYRNTGSDTTVVFLHGWGMNKNAFDNVIQFIDKDYSILTIDFLGFGESDNPENYYDTYEYTYHIFLYLKKLNIDNIILVGHSFGGRVAIILSSVFNLKIKHLILTSSAGLIRFSIAKSYKLIKYKLIKLMVRNKILNQNYLQKYGSSDYKKLNNDMKSCFVKIVKQNLKYILKYIKTKTSLVWDKADKETPYWMCKKFNRNIFCSQILIYQNGGHFTYIKNCLKFANLINGWKM